MAEYDSLARAREKARRYEQEAEALKEQNAKLIRMLAFACQLAAVQMGCDTLQLCAVIEDVAA